MAAVLRHTGTSTTLGNPWKNFNALSTQLDILFIIHKYGQTNALSLFISIYFTYLLSYCLYYLVISLTLCLYFISCFCLLLWGIMSAPERITWMVTAVPEAMRIDFRRSTFSVVAQCCNFQNHRTNYLYRPNTEFRCACYTSFLLYYITLMPGFDWH